MSLNVSKGVTNHEIVLIQLKTIVGLNIRYTSISKKESEKISKLIKYFRIIYDISRKPNIKTFVDIFTPDKML